jgi:HAD superfamily hydrolase (TIGR01509 family)
MAKVGGHPRVEARPTANKPQITQLLFDCDNTLVMSEELAFEACADIANEILARNDIADRYTGEELIQDFVGQNFRGMMVSLQAKYGFEIPKDEIEAYVKEEENKVIAKLEEKAVPCIGATEELERLQHSGKYDMAVVSSSALRRVRASIKKVNQDKYFKADHVFSAATSLPQPTSKPDPAIYLHALNVLGKKAEESVAIEDSRSGALSAIRAGIPVIAYVGSYHGDDKRGEMAAKLIELGAQVVMRDWAEFDSCLKQIEGQPAETSVANL